ncbi:hypothetical protein FOH10_09150 [Nocardia otitidiscaviarum]|uniref:Plasmid replication, integration and excision activator n=1 Tax=Nocardia otitidiscaviarum TaxID=1823 RepID=A0A516NIZ6_9NOCA|nr:hypothetical protein [Nocardia otitidiscaviarum]MCP9619677.1 hypothetical protein [Nocardia otitidiscaviarum]QDP78880.1 hypothetical protein FOH10_09150 [Nocardia otitidiscaviarum]
MALKDVWFRPEFGEAFPMGLLLMGAVEPMTEFSRDRNAPKRQKVDLDDDGNGTGKRLWKGTVMDPSGMGAKNASFDVTFVADVAPVPSADALSPNVYPVVLEGLQIKPRVVGNGEFKSIGWYIRATGIVGDTSGAKQAPADVPSSRPARDGKAAA